MYVYISTVCVYINIYIYVCMYVRIYTSDTEPCNGGMPVIP